ncbi:hypothetical protein ANN_01211 [Periplaneta americana]|uniref:DUF4817 domain-containing protein n=1 Tax=Periplaneta americana TaxID=6978 RepID=A0ABQ8TWZ9_PERAM|nr:hypothetical protein ANN_01211 [Periplaneta americana]
MFLLQQQLGEAGENGSKAIEIGAHNKEKKNLRPKVKYGGGGILVWGCISSVGVGTLAFIEGNMDHQCYINILKGHAVPSAENLGITDNFIFMQDNDPKHTAHNTRLWFLYNIPSYLQTSPQSPDINLALRTRHITSKESLKAAIIEEWNSIPESITSNLVNSMVRRLEAIVKCKGYPTNQSTSESSSEQGSQPSRGSGRPEFDVHRTATGKARVRRVMDHSRKTGVQDYGQLVEILTQRPLHTTMKLTTKLSEEDLKYMTEVAQQRFDKIMSALRAMPRTMLLVIRTRCADVYVLFLLLATVFDILCQRENAVHINQRLFLVKQYWITNSITATQRAYQREFGVRNPPKRNTILGLVNKLETTGSLTFIVQNPAILSIIWFTDEAWFHLSGYVNSQNSRHWAIENPHVIHEAPMHPVKIGVLCAISAQRIVGPIFFNQTVNTAEYRPIFMEFVEQLDDVELSQGYFQQDGATCHTSNESMELIASFFDDRIISRNLWPPRSPDLTTPDFFLWSYLKDRVYATRPQTLDDLKHNITQEIQAIDNRVLQRVTSNME